MFEDDEEWPVAPPPRRSRDKSKSSAAALGGFGVQNGGAAGGIPGVGSLSGRGGQEAMRRPGAPLDVDAPYQEGQVEDAHAEGDAIDTAGVWDDDFLPIEPVRSRWER